MTFYHNEKGEQELFSEVITRPGYAINFSPCLTTYCERLYHIEDFPQIIATQLSTLN